MNFRFVPSHLQPSRLHHFVTLGLLLSICLLLIFSPSLVYAEGTPKDSSQNNLPRSSAEPRTGPQHHATSVPPSPAQTKDQTQAPTPFGANMFTGAFAAQREDGVNPEYRIMPGDRVMVNAWGPLDINQVFTVDTQGNIFLPNIGPIHLADVENQNLTEVVRKGIARVYRDDFGVYTNLLTASPVAVFVTGGVTRPGRYAGIPSDSVLFFLDQAGGIDPDLGSFRSIKILRKGQVQANIDLYDFLLDGTIPTHQFQDGDTILVGQRGPTVTVKGSVPEPKIIEMMSRSFSGDDVLKVVPSGAHANHVTVRGTRNDTPIVQVMPIEQFRTFSLDDGDLLRFRQEGRPGQILVHLKGAFQGPSTLSVRRGTRLLDVLNYVRVTPELANTEAIHIQRESVAKQQRQAIRRSLKRLQRTAMLALSNTQGEASIRVQEAKLVDKFVKRAQKVRPDGRMVIKDNGRLLNVLLRDGDKIVIPRKTNVVHVTGEVQFTQAVMHRPGLTARDYIAKAGGYTNRANTDSVIVLRPSAKVRIGSGDIPVRPGDEIMIPPRIDNKLFQNVLDLSQIIFQVATSAGVLLRI